MTEIPGMRGLGEGDRGTAAECKPVRAARSGLKPVEFEQCREQFGRTTMQHQLLTAEAHLI